MNKSRLTRVQRTLAPKGEDRPRLPATPEEESALFRGETMQSLVAEAFSAEDRRASPEYLGTLTLPELHSLYMEAMDTSVAKALAADPPPPDLAAFDALPFEERIRLLTNDRLLRRWRARFSL